MFDEEVWVHIPLVTWAWILYDFYTPSPLTADDPSICFLDFVDIAAAKSGH